MTRATWYDPGDPDEPYRARVRELIAKGWAPHRARDQAEDDVFGRDYWREPEPSDLPRQPDDN